MMSDYFEGRLLVAHQEPNSRHALCEMLRRAGHEVIVAEDGLGALDLAAELLPDLVLLSASLPGLSGVHACERLHEDEDTAAIPVIMISTSAEPLARAQSLEAGAVDHVCTPFDLESLRFQVGNLVKLRRHSRLLESRLAKAERTERLRDEWVTYAVHEMEQALELLSEDGHAVDDALDMAKTILACRQMSHPKALVTLRSCDVAEMGAELEVAEATSEFHGTVQADPAILTRILSQLALAAGEQSPQEALPTLHSGAHGSDQLKIEVRAASNGIWHESYATLDHGSMASEGLDCQNRLELRLAFCKHAMDLMGGSIGVETSPEDGLCFWLTLPAAASDKVPNIIPFAAELLPYDTAASR